MLTVSDGDIDITMAVRVPFSISVLPAPNHPPVIGGAPLTRVDLDAAYSFTPTASDPDGDVLTFRATNLPTWASISSTTGAITGTPTLADTGASGIVITVTDTKGASASLAAFNIVVNHPPVANASGPYTIQINKPMSLDGSGSTDPENDALTYAWDFGDGSAPGTGNPGSHTYTALGDYTVTLTVSDGSFTSAPATAQVRVVDYDVDLNEGAASCSTLANGTNPVNGATGNKYQPEVDYAGAGVFPLNFTRHYNSEIPAKSTLGAVWRGSYDRSLVLDITKSPATVRAYRADNNVYTFTNVGGQWQAIAGVTTRLVAVSGGWQLIDDNDLTESYDTNGRLTTLTTRSGLHQNLFYDTSGKLSSVSDDFGRSLGFGYDGSGKLSTLTDPANRIISYGYDNNRNLTTVIYPGSVASVVRTYIYDDPRFPHALTGIIDENNKRYATWAYDAKGRGTRSTHAGGADDVTLLYNADGTTTITDAKGQARTYQYSNQNGVLKVSTMVGPLCGSCGGMTSSTTYDAHGYPNIVTDLNGNVTNYTYDVRGLEQQRIEAVGSLVERTVQTIWHSTYRVPVCVIEPSRTTVLNYYPNGQLQDRTLVDTTNPALFASAADKTCAAITARSDYANLNKRGWAYTYYPNGLLQTLDGPRTDLVDVTNYFYDSASGNLTQITNALGQPTDYLAYDADGRPKTIRDPNGVLTKLDYDARGRLSLASVGTDTAGYENTTYEYDGVGNLAKVTLPNGSFQRLVYDDAHRLTDTYDQLGDHIHYTLDALGNRKQTDVTDPANVLHRTQQAVFDQANHLIQTLGAANQSTDFLQYDNNGALKQVRDPGLNVTGYDYDALNRLTTTTDALNGTTVNGFDAQGNLISVKDPRNLVTKYDYDGLGNRIQLTSPDSGITQYKNYTGAGNVGTIIDARNKSTSYQYDALNRVKTITYNDASTAVYDYDTGVNGIGRLHGITDVAGTTLWEYNLHGRVTHQTQTSAGVSLSTGYAYDSLGQLGNMTLPSGRVVGYTYTQGQITALTLDGQALLNNISYEPFGPINGWAWANGSVVTRSYDKDGQLTSYPLGTGARQLAYYSTGNVQTLNDLANPANNQTFSYDALLRLSGVQGTSAETFGYDATGNRNSLKLGAVNYSNTVNAASNQLQNSSGLATKAYAYDAAGNITGDGLHTYQYDDRGIVAGIDNGAIRYVTNTLGLRLHKVGSQPIKAGDANGDGRIDALDTDTTLAVILQTGTAAGNADCNADGVVNVLDITCINNLISAKTPAQPASAKLRYAYDQSGQLLGEYDETGKPIQETITLNHLPVAVLQSGQTYNVYADQIGTPRAITDNSNVLVWRWDNTEAFGANAPNGDPASTGNVFTYNMRFAGQYADVETGLYYNINRYYDPSTGRYIQSDPVGLKGGVNSYAYVRGNPLSLIDGLGLEPDTSNSPYGQTSVMDPSPFAVQNSSVCLRGSCHGIAYTPDRRYSTPNEDNALAALNDAALLGASFAGNVIKQCVAKGVTNAEKLVIGRGADLAKPGELESGEFKFSWPPTGSAQSEWKVNSGLLRQEMGNMRPIRDASVGDSGGMYLNAERNLLLDRGWTFDANTNHWMP